MRKVVIFQHRLLHYKAPVFERLRTQCLEKSIDLRLVHGRPTSREKARNDLGYLPWANPVASWSIPLPHNDLIWLPFPDSLADADLVVLMQENRQLSNYPILLSQLWSKRKVAYWGHGANFQTDAPKGLRERWKRLMLKRVDWWFAYTEMTVDILRRAGYPAERITCLNNAINNEAFEHDLASVSDDELQSLRVQLDAPGKALVGLFCGSLYPDKRLDYMIAAGDRIHAALPAFRLVVIGDGPSAVEIRNATENRPWLKWVGVRKGKEKAAWFRLADVVINPGLVGLHILDSFCSGTPMITSAESRHSPEIAYLKNEVNGLVVSGNAERYANAVISLFSDAPRLEKLKHAALQDAKQYSLTNMVTQFADGIERCLATDKL